MAMGGTALILVATTFVVMFVNFILPTINLHLILNRELSLQQQAQNILDKSRSRSVSVTQSLMDLDIDGVEIEDIRMEDIADYTVYSIYFHHKGLFFNNHLKHSELYQQKKIAVVIDRDILIGERI